MAKRAEVVEPCDLQLDQPPLVARGLAHEDRDHPLAFVLHPTSDDPPIHPHGRSAVAGAVVVEWLRSHGRASGDLALAMIFYGGIALAVVVASSTPRGTSVNVLPYLFGSILTVTASDVRVIAALGLVIVATLLVAGRALFAGPH